MTATLLEQADEVPSDTEMVLVVEGYSDKRYLECAAQLHEREDLLGGMYIRHASGAHSAVIEANLMRSRGYEKVFVLLDDDDQGKSAKADLKRHYGFSGKQVLTYRQFLGDLDCHIEAEDLFEPKVLKRFIADHPAALTGQSLIKGDLWHYGFSQLGKETFRLELEARVKAKDCIRFIDALQEIWKRGLSG